MNLEKNPFHRGYAHILFAILIIMAGMVFLSKEAAAVDPGPDVMADFVFIIDASPSMGDAIAMVQSGLGTFVQNLINAGVDARFALVLYGREPELVLDFTSDGNAVDAAFGKINVFGAEPGFQNDHSGPREAGLEAIRMVLNCSQEVLNHDNVGGNGILVYRAGARKNLILITDEDSDQPFHAGNRQPGQDTEEPPSPTLDQAWQEEVDETAQCVILRNAFVNMLINPFDKPSRSQYGVPEADVSDPDLLNFDPGATLALMVNNGFGGNLESQVLDVGLIARSFDIEQVDDPDFIENFYNAKIEETVTGQPPIQAPALSGIGTVVLIALLGFGLLRARGRV